MGHELVALFGGGVETNGVVNAVIGAEGHFLVASVDAATAGVDQVLHGIMSACLQYVVESYYVALYVNIGVLNGVPYSGLSG